MADSAPDSAPAPGPRSEAEILADPRLRALLAGYQPMFHELCLKEYARQLQDLHYAGERYERELEGLLHQHDDAARRHLWLIQHQKLFDLECRWRAGQLTVPGARLTADFEDWHEQIQDCPVLEPITPDELAVFDAFLAQLTTLDGLDPDELTRTFWLHRRHPHLREADEDPDDDLLEWTQFWDQHRGTGYLRQLPDQRGDLEARYEKAVRDEQRRLNPQPPRPPDPRPHAPNYGPEFDDLVREWLRRFEPAAKLRQFEAKKQLAAYNEGNDETDLELALERLKDAGPGLIPIQAHADWRQAIIQAANRHYLDQLRAALPAAYEDYCQRQQLGIRHAPVRERRRKKAKTHFDWQQEIIREGRRLLGEPDDLDF